MGKIRYLSLLDMKNKRAFLESKIEEHPYLKIIEISHSLIVLSDGFLEYEYDCYEDVFEEWNMVFAN